MNIYEKELIERPQLGAMDSAGAMTVRFPLLRADRKTSSGSWYPKSTLAKAASDAMRRIGEGRMLGTGKPKGLPELDEISHCVTRMEMVLDTLYCTLKILPTDSGQNAITILREGGTLAAALKAKATTRNENQSQVVQPDLQILSVDLCLESENGTYFDKGSVLMEGIELEKTNSVENMNHQLDARYAQARLAGYKNSKESFFREVFTDHHKR